MDLGAADYIVKPFSPTELTARVRAALRRRAETEPFVLDDLVIHYEQRRVQVAGRPVQLTATEFDLLRVLSVNAGRVLTNEALLRQVWGGRDAGDACVKGPALGEPTTSHDVRGPRGRDLVRARASARPPLRPPGGLRSRDGGARPAVRRRP